MPGYFTVNVGRKIRYSSWRPLNRGCPLNMGSAYVSLEWNMFHCTLRNFLSDPMANMHDGNLGTTGSMSQKICYDWSHCIMIKFSSQYRFTKYMTFYRKNDIMTGTSRMSVSEWIALIFYLKSKADHSPFKFSIVQSRKGDVSNNIHKTRQFFSRKFGQ